MAKIRVLFQLNELSYSGTTKAVLTFCRNLNRDLFEPFLFYRQGPRSLRFYRHQIAALFSARAQFRFQERYVISQARKPEFESILGGDHIAHGEWSSFARCVQIFRPDIIHFSRGEEVDWYTDRVGQLPRSIKLVETSIFGKGSSPSYIDRLDRVFVISDWLKSQNPWMREKGRSLYLPIPRPLHQIDLRRQLGFGRDELVIGRISRPGLDSGAEVLNIFEKIKVPCRLLVLGGGPRLQEEEKINSNIRCLPPTTDESKLCEFYNTLDVLLHYRKEGETFGMSIADAMIHGRPVVSHRSFMDNAQEELLAENSGFVVSENDFEDHAEKIEKLLVDSRLRGEMGRAAQARAMRLFESHAVTKKLENEYLQIVGMTLPPQTGI